MKNEYYYNGIKVKDITLAKSPKSKVLIPWFILENASSVVANRSTVEIKCHNCGKLSRKIFTIRQEDHRPYICASCANSGKNNPMYGKNAEDFMTPESIAQKRAKQRRANSGKNNPMYGKNSEDFMTPESIAQKRAKQSRANSGKNNPMYGRSIQTCMTPEAFTAWKQHISDGLTKLYETDRGTVIKHKLSARQRACYDRNPVYYKHIKSKAAIAAAKSRIKYKQNMPEKKVSDWLLANNIVFNYSAIMGDGNNNWQYDFIVRHKRILIEVDGDYWHGNPTKYNNLGTNGKKQLNATQISIIEKDKIKTEYAKNHNFTLIRIWESEINAGDFSKLEIIKNANQVS